MIKIPLYSQLGEKKEPISITIAERFAKLNEKLISQALYIEQNNSSRKSGHTQTKGEVSGGGRKPWKQKGTGRARAGSSRSPLFKGGGVTFGPHGINKHLEMPSGMKQLAVGQMLANKVKLNEVIAIDSLECKDQKTKTAAVFISKVASGKQSIFAFRNEEKPFVLAWRNLALVSCSSLSGIKLNDLQSSKFIVMSKEGIEETFNKFK